MKNDNDNKNTDTKNKLSIKADVKVSKVKENNIPSIKELTVYRKIDIFQVRTKSMYASSNIKHLPSQPKMLPISASATSKMLQLTNITLGIMPSIIDISPKDPAWNRELIKYWNELYELIPAIGKKLDTSIRFYRLEKKKEFEQQIINIERRYSRMVNEDATNIDSYYKEKTQELLRVEDEIHKTDENGKKIYAVAVNPKHYILWLYCSINSRIANKVADIDKTSKILFYLENPLEAKEEKKKNADIITNAEKLYYSIEEDIKKIDDLIYLVGTDKGSIKQLEQYERRAVIREYIRVYPIEFIKIANDTNLSNKARIERMIHYGVLKRIGDTGIIVSAENPTDKVGNSVNEAILFFNEPNAKQEAVATELIYKFKALNK